MRKHNASFKSSADSFKRMLGSALERACIPVRETAGQASRYQPPLKPTPSPSATTSCRHLVANGGLLASYLRSPIEL